MMAKESKKRSDLEWSSIVDSVSQDMMTAMIMAVFIVLILPVLMPSLVSAQVGSAQYYSSQIYYGGAAPRRVNASGSVVGWLNLLKEDQGIPWVAFDMVNYGPNSVFIAVNNPDQWKEVAVGDGYSVNFLGATRRIETVFYKCNPGENASFEIVGKY